MSYATTKTTVVPTVMHRCPECGSEWDPFATREPAHTATCSTVRIPKAFLAYQPPQPKR